MDTGSIAIIAGIVSAFLLFAVVLMWADRYSYTPRSQAASAHPSKPPQSIDRVDRLAA